MIFLEKRKNVQCPGFLRAIQPPLANKIFQNIFLSYHTLSHFFGCQQLLPSDAVALPSTSTPGSCCSHIRKESFVVLCKAARYSYMTKSPNCALGRAATPLLLSSSWLMNRMIPGYPNIWKRHFQKQQTSAVKCSCRSGRWSRFLCKSVFSPSWQRISLQPKKHRLLTTSHKQNLGLYFCKHWHFHRTTKNHRII